MLWLAPGWESCLWASPTPQMSRAAAVAEGGSRPPRSSLPRLDSGLAETSALVVGQLQGG